MNAPLVTRGFLLTREWLRRSDGGQDLVYWLATDKGPVQVVRQREPSVCFVRTEDRGIVEPLVKRCGGRVAGVALKSFDDAPVVACYFPCQSDLVFARTRLAGAVRLLEADVRPQDRYLMERFLTGAIELSGEARPINGYLRMENPSMRATDYAPALMVASLDIETSWTENVIYSIAIHVTGPRELRQVFMVGTGSEVSDLPEWLEMVATESELIVRFLRWFNALDPDVIIGWRVVGFDLRFIQQRCDALDIPFTLGRGEEPVRWRNAGGDGREIALVPGRVVLDGIETLRSATWSFESFSLEHVARALLGRGKLVEDVDARAVEIQEMYRTAKRKLAEYNLEDCVLVSEIFSHANLIEFVLARARMTGLELDRPGGSVAAFDFLYLPRLHRAGYVAPVVVSDAGVGSPGGYVLDSRPGLYEHVIVLDFKSLYPSIIRTFHVDPLAMVRARAESDPIPGFNGAAFSRTDCILPALIESLWSRRDEAKRMSNAPLSQAIKIIMNSFYGVLGTPGCRFFDPRLVSSITLRGHEILQTTRALIEERGFPVIYGDTDSVFVLLDGVDGADVNRRGTALTQYLNQWWKRHLRETVGVESCLEVEFETHFEKFLMPKIRGSELGSKKRYAGLLKEAGEGGEGQAGGRRLVFKGLEAVRSDWSPLAREFQQELYRRIFLDEPFESFVRETVDAVRNGERDADLVLRRRLRRELSSYTKTVPPHVRAARRAEEVRRMRGLSSQSSRGSWVEYVMTRHGPEPRQYVSSPIDYDFYIDRQLAPIADAILSLKSTSLAELVDQQISLF